MEKYVITGSLGHISKPLVTGLVKAGKSVQVITSDPNKVADIENLGATAIVGSVQDREFVRKAFEGANVAYTMIPPIWKTDNWRKSQNEVGKNYADAILSNGVKYVVNLSSIGAHAGNGIGPVDGLADFEKLLNNIPGLNVKHLRPSYFYYNFFSQIGLIKQAGILGANFGSDDEKIYLAAPKDIAAAALDELLNLNFSGSSVRYIISDERSGKEIAEVLGNSIGKAIPWVVFTDEQQKEGLLQAGISETHAEGYTQMGVSMRSGKMMEDARKLKPTFAPTKLEEFAKEFAAAFKE
jgi:uncharacterized protein YbjT (DUF2867 family)